MKEKFVPQRNITPNFIRFKRKPSSGKQNGQDNCREERKNAQRSASKGSRCSFEVYEKRVLNLSKLRHNLNANSRADDKDGDSFKRKIIELRSRRASEDKSETEPENQRNLTIHVPQGLMRKRSSGKSLRAQQRDPRDKGSNLKRTEESLEKEEERARLANLDLWNNLGAQNQNTFNYLNKLKIKKNENAEKRKCANRKKMLNCSVAIKNQEALKCYEIYGQLGKGAYGIVRMGVTRQTGERVAVKVYEKKRLDEVNKIRNLERQINILSALDHPVIAKLIQTIETPTQIYLILEYGGANSLYSYLLSKPEHRLPEEEAKMLFKKIAQTLAYLHEMDIVHRDIKAQNILLNRHKQLKLIDFGFSLESRPPSTIDTFCGTPTYMAPEVVSKRDHVPVYTDMWSMGILFYVMLQGNYPFRAKTEDELFEKIRKGKFDYIYDNISDKSKQIIESLLRVNPLKRLKIDQILSECHNWQSSN